MRQILILSVLLLSSAAWAHGNMVQQAQGATDSCLKFMLDNEPKKLIHLFKSVHTEVAGNEQFSVQITLRDGTSLNYKNHSVPNGDDTVTWVCER
jgi:hypothetical protein